ncbi:MAG: TonB-dependent receptor [Lutibacter sp.]|nr:MAG: TonB-dependent receptor [Lutibacter sp.]
MQKITLPLLLLAFIFNINAQKINISGTILESESEQKLEYATIIFTPAKKAKITGGISDANGKFDIEIKSGIYDITIEFLSLETKMILNQNLTKDTNLGIIKLNPSAEALDEIEIIAEKSTVEIRLDKKIYNVGKDMTVKGGTASDVLDNVPSVTVDVEGNISLRGSENVRILINGKPSTYSSDDALRQLPAEAIEKVEVITSPSARYDAEGTAGILNIVLRKGKAQGLNGTVSLSANNPEGYGISTNFNLRAKKFNFFNNIGFSESEGPGNAIFEKEFLQTTGNPYQYEDRKYIRSRKSFNTRFGVEYTMNDFNSITTSVGYRKSNRGTDTEIFTSEKDLNFVEQELTKRNDIKDDDDDKIELNFNYTRKFKNDGHQLTFDMRHEKSAEDEFSNILTENINPTPSLGLAEKINSIEDDKKFLIQSDYVLPIGEDAQFEAGFRINDIKTATDYTLNEEQADGTFIVNDDVSNLFTYNENVTALYTQYGNKFGKFSALLGLRFEISDIEIISEGVTSEKNYNQWFPTLNLAYQINDEEDLTLGYNRRIRRPRHWFINPFPSRASESNVFQGNPDLNPAYTNGVDLGYLKKFNKVTFNTSLYYNYTTDVFERVSTDEEVNGQFITTSTVLNVASEDRFGLEFSLNYSAAKWLRLNTNFNFFKETTDGNNIVPDSKNDSWSARFNSRVKLPAKIDWQTTISYRGPNENFQRKSKGIASVNLAFSKDLLKEKATLSLNVSDLFNSRKRFTDTFSDTSNIHSEFQWRERQIRLNFTYRFNQKKKRTRERSNQNGGGEFEGGGF